MLDRIKILRKNLDNFEGKIEFVTYISSVLLLLLHVLFFLFYIYARINVMIGLSVVGIIIFNHYVHNGIKDPDFFGIVCYSCITVHVISAMLSIGWASGYYLWLFGIECAFFLPSFGSINKNAHRPLFLGILFALIYFVIGFLLSSGTLKPLYKVSDLAIIILFGVNSIIVFFTIISFTYFFTTRQKFKENKLKHLADYDNLTNLKNRNAINRELDERIKNGEEFSLSILDIDLFKHVNDTYGHNAGDAVLKGLAKKLTNLEGFGISSARWGGEEFIILGPSDMSHQQFIDIIRDLRRSVRESVFKYEKSIIKITISAGVSYKKKKTDIKKCIEVADKRLYKAKQTGRNQVIYK